MVEVVLEDWKLKCRICAIDLTDLEQGIRIYGKSLDEKIKKYLYVTIDMRDPLPKRICGDCFVKLETFHQFATLAQKTQECFLIKFLSHKTTGVAYVSPIKPPINHIPIPTIVQPPILSPTISSSTVSPTVQVPAIKQHQKVQRPISHIPPPHHEVPPQMTITIHNDIKLGQLIKDHDLLRLILRALKWNDHRLPIDTQVECLRNCSFREVLSNENLLLDEDLMYLLGPYLNPAMFPGKPLTASDHIDQTASDDKLKDVVRPIEDSSNVTEMEVGIDPELYFLYDEEETRSCDSTSVPIVKKSIDPVRVEKKKRTRKQELIVKDDQERKPDSSSISHTNVKPVAQESQFTCLMCNKLFLTKGNLTSHMESHITTYGRFNCDKCDRIFLNTRNLLKHQQHHKGRQYQCDICKRVYATYASLRTHRITHSNLRPYKCHICSKSFKRSQDLRFHVNQHTGNKPYKCRYCAKTFASSGNCFAHRKRIHEKVKAILTESSTGNVQTEKSSETVNPDSTSEKENDVNNVEQTVTNVEVNSNVKELNIPEKTIDKSEDGRTRKAPGRPRKRRTVK